MKVQVIILTEKQKTFLETIADVTDVDWWVNDVTKTSPSVEVNENGRLPIPSIRLIEEEIRKVIEEELQEEPL